MVKNLKMTNDFVFHKIFGEKGNEEILKSLIESVINRKINNLEIMEDTKLETAVQDDKLGILDVKTVLSDGTKVDVEIQVANEKNIEKRTLFYWAKLYTQYIKKGTEYEDMAKTIAINILNYNFLPENMYHRICHIAYDDLKREILTDNLEIHFLDLTKLKKKVKNAEDYLTLWLGFLEGSRRDLVTLARDKVKAIEKAAKKLEKLQQDTGAWRVYELKQKWEMDEASRQGRARREGLAEGMEKGRKQGTKQGIEQGIKQGIEQGIEQGRKEIAQKMLANGISIEEVSEITNINVEKLKKLLTEM